jgi:type IV pilus assembly protein PilC
MIYPAVLVTAMTGIAIFMITTIIPKIAEVYKEYGSELPLVTRVLLGISDLFRNYLLVVIFFLFLVYLAYRSLRKNPTSDFLLNNMFFKVPVFGPLNRETALTLICRTLSILLASGVAILDALRIVSKTVANNYFRAGLLETATLVEKGMPLSLALRRNPEFPLMLSQLTAIGEETGTVDQSLERLAKFYQDSTERKVKNLTTLLEPMMLLLMGGMVGGLAIAVLMPIFNLVSVIH